MSTKHLACDHPEAPATPDAPIGDAPPNGIGALPANGRPLRQPLPAVAERLQRMFPDVWARYQAALAAATHDLATSR